LRYYFDLVAICLTVKNYRRSEEVWTFSENHIKSKNKTYSER